MLEKTWTSTTGVLQNPNRHEQCYPITKIWQGHNNRKENHKPVSLMNIDIDRNTQQSTSK